MVTLNKNQSTHIDQDHIEHDHAGISDAVKEYSDELLKKVQENPLTSVLIAAGVGFLLSTLLKK